MSGPPEILLDRMGLADLDEVTAIEQASFASPWSRRAFGHELRENRVAHLWVARSGSPGPVVGYLCLWLIADELHVTNFAVRPDHRGRGVGRLLLGVLLEHYRRQGARRATLEVRPSNGPARHLYARFGFREVGRRRGYYFDTGEDALVLEADLAGPVWNPSPGLSVSPA